ncbi:MAG: hypothetical protein AVDCRST_MAG57-1369, partial [uncultured Blastococcus sp.]
DRAASRAGSAAPWADLPAGSRLRRPRSRAPRSRAPRPVRRPGRAAGVRARRGLRGRARPPRTRARHDRPAL